MSCDIDELHEPLYRPDPQYQQRWFERRRHAQLSWFATGETTRYDLRPRITQCHHVSFVHCLIRHSFRSFNFGATELFSKVLRPFGCQARVGLQGCVPFCYFRDSILPSTPHIPHTLETSIKVMMTSRYLTVQITEDRMPLFLVAVRDASRIKNHWTTICGG